MYLCTIFHIFYALRCDRRLILHNIDGVTHNVCATCPANQFLLDSTVVITLGDTYNVYTILCKFFLPIVFVCGLGSSVGIATDYGLDGPGIESRWGRNFPPVQTSPGAHTASCTMRTGSFPGLKCGRGLLLTTHPLLVPRSWKSRAILLPTLWATPGL